ncbi:MAG TPA: DUF2911 domain-containing protein [Gemmatimonadales bacterium]|nr:DUF2911 domain-containing protein [Gemmatimonadales bacterium]
MSLVSILAGLAAGVSFAPAPAAADTACIVQNPQRMPAEGRPSPLDSLTFTVGQHSVKVCYGRPSLRGRKMLGGTAVPYGKLWRTGANEPTVLYTPVALEVAGVEVAPGLYSLYTVPGEKEWEIIVNRATAQWGHEGQYTDEVRKQEVGRGKAPAERNAAPVETFTIRAEPGTGGAQSLLLEWENTRVRIPVTAG